MKRSWKILRRLFFALRLLLLLLVLLAVCVYAYLHFAGVPPWLRDHLVRELASHGVAASFGRIGISLPTGVVADNVALGDARQPGMPVVRARRVRIDLDLRGLWQRRLDIAWLELVDGELSVPLDMDDPKSERIEAHNINGRVRLSDENVITVEQVTADSFGLRLTAQGRLRLPKAKAQPRPPAIAKEHERGKRQLRNILAETRAVKFDHPPRVTLTFDANVDELAAAQASLRIEAGRATHPKVTVEQFMAQFHYKNQLLTTTATNVVAKLGGGQFSINEARYDFVHGEGRASLSSTVDLKALLKFFPADTQPRVAAWQPRAAPALDATVEFGEQVLKVPSLVIQTAGGALSLTNASYDFKNEVAMAEVSSTLDLKQLALFMPRGWQRQLADWQWKRNPKLSFHWLWTKADPDHPTISDGQLTIQDASFRGIPIELGTCRASLNNDVIVLSDALVKKPEGSMGGTYECHLSRQDYRFTEIESTADPLTLAPILPPTAMQMVQEFTLARPPEIKGGEWTGNWQRMEGQRCRGHIKTGPLTWRGVSVEQAASDFVYTNNVLHLGNLTLARPEGRLSGHYQYNFTNADFGARITGTLELAALRPVLGETPRRLLEQYRTEQPVELDIKNISGNWLRPGELRAEGKFKTGAVAAGVGRVKSVQVAFTVDPAAINVSKFTLKVPTGTVEGQLAHNRASNRMEVTVSQTQVMPAEVAALLGSNAVAAVSPYRFTKPPKLFDIKTVVDFADPRRNSWHAVIQSGEFGWWKLRTGRVGATLHYADEILTISDFHAENFYGGRLLCSNATFNLSKQAMRYKVALRVDEARRVGDLLFDMFSYKNVSGTATGEATVEGIFGDNNSIQASGEVNLYEARLWTVPILGTLSQVLGMVMPGKFINPPATDIDMTFRAEKGFVYLPANNADSPVTIKASPHQITGRGRWQIQGNLDFKVQSRILAATGFSVPFGWLFDPITKIFEMELVGTLSKPEWHPRYLPHLPAGSSQKPAEKEPAAKPQPASRQN